MTWVPTPLETDGVRLPESLEALEERLAANTHDVWARQRIADGWRYGPTRDDAKKTHPSLVPYDELPESEKEYDRRTSRETLRAILKLRYRIVAPPIGGDEMHDAAEVGRPQRLEDYLLACADVLVAPFEEADASALGAQARHRETTRTAATALSAAIIAAAILQALDPTLTESAKAVGLFFEAGFAFVAVVAVITGYLRFSRDHWLLQRARAEQIRLLKFRVFGDAAFWCGPRPEPGAIRARLQRELDELPAAAPGLHEVSEGGAAAPPESAGDCTGMEPGLWEALRGYYRRKRLSVQQEYFETRAERKHGRWYDNQRILPVVFFASLAFVIAHVLFGSLEWLRPEIQSSMKAGSAVFAALAAIFPAAWAGVRTYKQANEFLRNRSRARARRRELDALSQRLDAAADPLSGFAAIALCEYVLAHDQAEWVRVMLDAEWYGG
jgi:ryanodine receptor 2